MVDSNFSFFSHLVGRRGLARHPASDTAGKKRISNFEQGMPNYEVFSPFDIYPPIFWGGFYSLFDLPAMPMAGFKIVFQLLINNTIIITLPAPAWQAGILRFYLVNPRTLESLWLYLLTNSFGDVSNINALMVYRQEEFW